MLTKGRKVNTLYVLEANIKKEDVNVAVKDSDIETWYKRLGHIGEKRLEILAKKGFLPNFTGMFHKICIHYLVINT